MRNILTKLIRGLVCLAPVALFLLASCGGGGGGSAPPPPLTPPSAPTNVVATSGGPTQVHISWTAVTGATGYNIYRSAAASVAITAGNKITATPVAASPYTNTGLSASTQYFYKVTAVNADGESTGSTEANATTAAIPSYGQMGGSIQGNSLILSTAVSTLAGISGSPGFADATGTLAQFYSPAGITTDGMNLYVADTTNHIIRKIVISTGAVTTVAGTALASGSTDATGAAARFNGPQGITTDGTDLYVADAVNHTIRKIVISTGVVTTVAGTALAFGSTDATGAAARFYGPQGITTDGTNLYVADSTNHTIRKIVISTGVVTTVAGTALAFGSTDATGTAARFTYPVGITTDGTNLYDVDTGKHTIRKIQ